MHGGAWNPMHHVVVYQHKEEVGEGLEVAMGGTPDGWCGGPGSKVVERERERERET